MIRTLVLLSLFAAAACAATAAGGDDDDTAADAATRDAAAHDVARLPDAAPDATPGGAGTCQPCTANADCVDGHLCQSTGIGSLCLPRCSKADPTCPAGFSCGGVKSTFCAPIDGICCVDFDDDAYGEGAGCLGPDCVDDDDTINPGEPELCNGVDDDCDSTTADGADDSGIGVACDGIDTDLCEEGVTQCAGGDIVCDDVTDDSIELCNGLDDDCITGTTDGSGDPAVGIACDGFDGDLCEEGISSCAAGGTVVCSDITGTTVDLCNGADDDCNPTTADGSADPSLGLPCDGGDGDLCEEGVIICAGALGLQCNDTTGTTVDLCNGLDDDCDTGSADGSEDPAIGGACDGPDSDLCEEGVMVCSVGSPVCSDASGDDLEICNGLDDDCDGPVDEDFDFDSDPATCGDCFTSCSALCCVGACTPTSATDCGACGRACSDTVLVINEIMINPNAVADSQGEWFELVNLSGWDIDLRGFIMSDDGSDTHTITSANPVIIVDGGYAILGNNADFATNGGITVDYQYSGTALGNSGDEMIITAHGVELDRFEWNASFEPVGSSKELSIGHQTTVLNDDLTNWCTAVFGLPGGDNGTPGAANDCSL